MWSEVYVHVAYAPIALSRRLAHYSSLKPEEALINLQSSYGRVTLHLEAQRLACIACTGTPSSGISTMHTTIVRV